MIRAMSAGDVPRCVQVIRGSFLTVADEFGFTVYNAPRFTAFAVSEERLRAQAAEHRPMYVYVRDSGIVGHYSLDLRGGARCELNNLCVLPACRHGGIGGKLLAHAFQTAQALGCGKMEIGIVEENQRLRRWYETFGFIHTGTKKFDFFPFTCGYMEKDL